MFLMLASQPKRRKFVSLAAIGAFTTMVFVIDMLTPPAVDVWVFYLPVILAPAWDKSARQIVVVACICSVLVAVGSLSYPLGIPPLFDAMNRAMDILALWLTAGAAITIAVRSMQRKKLELEVLHIAEREQSRIGRELHDGVGQELTGLGLMANALQQSPKNLATQNQIAGRLVDGIDRVHRQVRTLSHGLVPVLVEAKGLWAALDELAATTSAQSGIPVIFDCPLRCEVASHNRALELFRIVQEAVANALRHGKPRNIHVSLRAEGEGLRLSVQDDGVGLPVRSELSSGMGLRIMEYRARLIGGALQVGPAAGGGTLVTCAVPLGNSNGNSIHGSEIDGDARENINCR